MSSVVNLTGDLLKKAKEELNENPETRGKSLDEFRKKVAAEPNFTCRTDDDFLISFLRCRKFDVDAAHQLLLRYYRQQLDYAKLYLDYRPSTVRYIFDDISQPMFLPDRDQYGRAVYVWRLGKWDPSKFSLEEVYRAVTMSFEEILEHAEVQVNGYVVINDMEDFGPQHAKSLMPQAVYKFVMLIQEAFPMDIKGYHIIRQPLIFDAVLALIKPFLNEYIRSILYTHGMDMETFHQHVTPDCLPKELGGRKPPINNAEYYKSLLAKDNHFLPIANAGFQSIRKTGQRSEDNVFGSSYKKLDAF